MWSSTFIDDMGLKILPQKSGEILLEIIMRRYENRSTMMTFNRPIEEWGKLLSDVPAASAIHLTVSPCAPMEPSHLRRNDQADSARSHIH
jgi:DNA replication protein DnaC